MISIDFGDAGHQEEATPHDLLRQTDSSDAADPDIIPRRLTITVIAGSILGIAFWAALTILLVRYV